MGDQIEKNEMGGTYRGKNRLQDPAVNGRIILRWIFRK
jgi:hypothetical protein